jgi:hypothetical protein
MKITKTLEIRAQLEPWNTGVGLLISQGDKILLPEDIKITKQEPGTVRRASVSIDRNQAQILIDDLWAAGFRPTEGTGSAGSLKATQDHLEDMRKLVFSNFTKNAFSSGTLNSIKIETDHDN